MAAPPYKRPQSVLVLVYTVDKQVLLLRRRQLKHFWQSVSGSLEWGETPQHAAVRELYEETGLSERGLIDCKTKHFFLIYPLWRCAYAPTVIENCEYHYRLSLDQPCAIRLDQREHLEYGWFSITEALAKVGSHTNRAAIHRWLVDEPLGLHRAAAVN